jgi:predicted histone-like DNA-binding protein
MKNIFIFTILFARSFYRASFFNQNKFITMKYKLIQRRNPQKPDDPQKWYAVTANQGMVSQRQIADDIVALSSLSRGDISNVIDNLLDTIPRYLLMGKSVNLSGLGTFRLSFSSKAADTPEKFNANLISGIKVIFTPSPELKSAVSKAKVTKA